MISKKPARGEIWLVKLDPTIGREQAKTRPCLVVSANAYNTGPAELVVVMPITGTDRDCYWFIPIYPPEGGLSKPSSIICDQVRSVSLQRLVTYIGLVDDEEILVLVETRLYDLFYLLPR